MRYLFLIFLLSSCSHTKKYNCEVRSVFSKQFFRYSVYSISEEKAKAAGEFLTNELKLTNIHFIGAMSYCKED